jgi:hypothetical protein
MKCARCAGLSTPEFIVEGGARIFAMRCLHCGDVIDHVILMNRLLGEGGSDDFELRSMRLIGQPGGDPHQHT